MKFINTAMTIKIIGFYQIIGGIIGLGLTGKLLLNSGVLFGQFLLFYLIAIFLFGYSIQSGNLILRKNKLKKGLIYSIILQGLQLVTIAFNGNKYEFFSGARGTLGIAFSQGLNLKIQAKTDIIGSGFNLAINTSDKDCFMCINIIAIVILSLLINIYRKLRNPKIVS